MECGAATQKVHLVQGWGGVRGLRRTSARFHVYSVRLLFWSRQGVSSEHMTTGLPSSARQEKECVPNLPSKLFQRNLKILNEDSLISQLFLLHVNDIKWGANEWSLLLNRFFSSENNPVPSRVSPEQSFKLCSDLPRYWSLQTKVRNISMTSFLIKFIYIKLTKKKHLRQSWSSNDK